MTLKRIQLGLIHVAVAMTLVPINSTLNRVMIKELAISATLVALLASLPYLFSPVQVAIGSFSDRHPLFGYRRSPYILAVLVLCVVGLTLSPLAAFQMEYGLPSGFGLALLAFGAWGMGFNFATVSYLSLATEISGERGRGRNIAVMFFMMITSIIITAVGLSHMVDSYTPQALVRAFWVVGLAVLFLGMLGLVGLEQRSRAAAPSSHDYSWPEMFRFILENRQAKRFFWYLTVLLAAILGQDILLEPFGGEAFGLSVRQTTHNANPWCSSVCCMYATKRTIITKEHDSEIEPTIFYMEMRAFGKDFDKYVKRAKNEYSVRYLRAMISAVREDPVTGNLFLRYAAEDGKLIDETFDMVVLSVGLEPHKDAVEFANTFGIEINPYRFAKTSPFKPVRTTRNGIFVTGTYQGPKDIPETVMQGSAVAGEVMALLSDARGTETVIKKLPPEKDLIEEEPRIGVFVCHCGINIASTVDVEKVVGSVKDLPGVVYATNTLYACSQDSQEMLKTIVREMNLNRVVVASCTPRTHEPLFQETIRDAGLNKYLFDLADIREQCSWCHMGQKEEATKKAIQIVKMAIAKTRLLEPLRTDTVGVTPAAMVIGGGIAGMTVALSLADQGFQTYLIEKEEPLGGLLKSLHGNRCRE